MSANNLQVYWQPGCTSCLKVKEFLSENGISYESVNIREQTGAIEQLKQLGADSVPVVVRGDRFVYCQELDDLIEFLELDIKREILPVTTLAERINEIMQIAKANITLLPVTLQEQNLPGRERTGLDLAYHIYMIPVAFLDATDGNTLTMAHFEKTPTAEENNITAIIMFADTVIKRFSDWWQGFSMTDQSKLISTYYGKQPLHNVLERTCWHMLQHNRQLVLLLESAEVKETISIPTGIYAGLPLPEHVWDDEVQFNEQIQ